MGVKERVRKWIAAGLAAILKLRVKARVRKWLGTEEIATNVAELRDLLTSGTVRVDETMSTMTRIHLQNNKDKNSFRSRLVECRKGHGPIGQIFTEWLNEWIGACKECDDCPQDQA